MSDMSRRSGEAMSNRSLSDDVYLLAGLLGEVLQSLGGQHAFELEEDVRQLAKNLRRNNHVAGIRLDEVIRGADTGELRMLIRAFTNYFQLINLSEDNERIRRVRRREHANPDTPRRGSIQETISMLADRGITADQIG